MMMRLLKWFGLALVLLIAYLLLWPVPIEPVSWNVPKSDGYVGDFEQNNMLADVEVIGLGAYSGPEDVAQGPDGKIYMPSHEGAILTFDPKTSEITEYAKSNGRTLGIEFGPDGILYGADAYQGLVKFENGEEKVIASKTSSGSPIPYADDLDVTKEGVVYFSDASTKYGAKESGGTLAASLLDLMEHGLNGRVLKYDPTTGKTDVVLDGLSFANGIALTEDERHLLIVETGTYSVIKLALDGSGKNETIIDNLPGFPDNINPSTDGKFWVGLVSPRNDLVDNISDKPFLRKMIMRLPEAARPKPERYGFIIEIDEHGNVTQNLQDPAGTYALTTGAITAANDTVYVSSLTEPGLGVLRRK